MGGVSGVGGVGGMCEDKWLVDRDQGCPVVSARPGMCVPFCREKP